MRILCGAQTERAGQSFPGPGEAALVNMEMGGRGG